ncbi:hypothetical protein BpHYR1_041431 [Brachionus plicatilis]|uniref:Uncharacterized protein n=1 Tax=Brachionus plicatilis TaxID=10195 RepID=A0A3M7PUH5_BRAPC|nr:hypothetical protein BpHYR1_041431 [Brachionus plicatilis]
MVSLIFKFNLKLQFALVSLVVKLAEETKLLIHGFCEIQYKMIKRTETNNFKIIFFLCTELNKTGQNRFSKNYPWFLHLNFSKTHNFIQTHSRVYLLLSYSKDIPSMC